MKKYWYCLMIVLVLNVFSDGVYAKKDNNSMGGIKSKKTIPQLLSQKREGVSQNISKRINNIFFKDRDHENGLKSEVKLRFDLLKVEREDPEFKARLKVKIHFPSLSVIIGNYRKDDLPGDDLIKDNTEISTGIRHYLLKLKKLVLSVGYGVTIRNRKGVTFGRLRLLKHSIKIKKWKASLHQSVFWYSDDGWGELTQMDFDRQITEKALFRATSAGLYSEISRGFELEQSYILGYEIKRSKSNIFFRISGFAFTEPEFDIDRYRADLVYRLQMVDPWLFFDIAPQIEFPAIRNFRGVPGIRFGLDSVF